MYRSKKAKKLRRLKEFNKARSNPRLVSPKNNNALQIHRAILVNFWKEYGYGTDKKRQRSYRSKEEVIAKLVKLGELVLTYKSPVAKQPYEIRHEYNTVKKKLRGYNHFQICFACGVPATVRHHIIWIKNGGRNSRKNIIPLCRPCHAEIHPWLR